MRNAIIAAIALVGFAGAASAQVRVDGHVRKDGTYVPPHVRTAPNSTRNDNWSTKGNTNPTTGREGTQQGGPNPAPKPPRY